MQGFSFQPIFSLISAELISPKFCHVTKNYFLRKVIFLLSPFFSSGFTHSQWWWWGGGDFPWSNPQSTSIYRVPQCMSSRRNRGSPTPSLKFAPPPRTKGGGEAHLSAGEGSQFRRLEKKLCTLPSLGSNPTYKRITIERKSVKTSFPIYFSSFSKAIKQLLGEKLSLSWF